ncbi:alpha/beta fold hydrolase [Plantactinospora sp. WMMB782]|uniref:alpha/beta fold hydrolase n=1 Tax=Plantactinospora sp. WMMB782 TaxID=3404121 RepID=UPI003B9258AE
MPFVTLENARIAYTVEGEGPPLVLVHGTAFDSAGTWGHLVEEFPGRTVIRPDFSGAGATTDSGGRLTERMLAEQVAAVVDEVCPGTPVDLVGFSLGAVVAAVVAATRPELVRRLVLTAGWTRPDDPYLATFMRTWYDLGRLDPVAFGRFGTLAAFSPPFLAAMGQQQVDAICQSSRPTTGALRQIDVNLTADIRPLLTAIRAETLVIGCTRDATVPVGHARELHAAISGSQYREIDSGHVVLFERPAEFAALVRDFVHRA